MVFADSVGAILAFAALSAGDACVEAFAVLFLALALLAVAAPALMFGMLQLMAQVVPGLLDLVLVGLVVAAAVAVAVVSAHLALPEALAVHLQAFGLFAGAAVFLFLRDGGRGGNFAALGGDLLIDGEGGFVEFEQVVGDLLVEADGGVDGEVFLGLNQLEGVGDVGDGGEAEEALAKQVDLAHILYCSVKLI